MADEIVGKALIYVEADVDVYRITRFEGQSEGMAPTDWVAADGSNSTLLGDVDAVIPTGRGIRLTKSSASTYTTWLWQTPPDIYNVSVVALIHFYTSTVEAAVHVRRTAAFQGYALYITGGNTLSIRGGNGADWATTLATATISTLANGDDVWMKLEVVGALVRGKSWVGELSDEPSDWAVSFSGGQALLHFDGADGVQVFPDANYHVWTAVGNVQVDTAQSKFGGASGLFDGTGDYLTGDGSEEFILGTGAFTIDFWVRLNAVGTTQVYYDSRPGIQGIYLTIYKATDNTIRFFTNSADRITGTTVLTTGTWYHIALTRSGTSTRLFLNGTQEGSTYSDSNSYLGNAPVVGADGLVIGTNAHNGWIDELRVVKGIAAWTANFTPPASAYTVGPGDVGIGIFTNGGSYTVGHFRASSVLSDVTETLRYAAATDYLPPDIPAIPNLLTANLTPARLSLGENLGERATLQASFRDHKGADGGELFDSGSYWGKIRARGLLRRTLPVRLIRGFLDEELSAMETRHFVIENTDGPGAAGGFNLIGKDPLKLADDERSLAPRPNNGFLVAGITNVATSATLSPSGIGNLEYSASGYLAIGGKEIVSFTRSGDVLTITRAQFGTTAIAHSAEDRVQQCLYYNGVGPDDIIYDLFTTYAGIDPDLIALANWSTEVDTYLQRVYTRMIAEPTGVNKLVSELISQAGLVVWPDDLNDTIKLQVIRAISTTAFEYNHSNILSATIQVQDQPDKKVTEVWTYYGVRNPLEPLDQPENYRSALSTVDLEEETFSGASVIKTVYGTWIPFLARTTAERINDLTIARFATAPRRFSFSVLRRGPLLPEPGGGYRIKWYGNQDEAGESIAAPIEVTSVNPMADRVVVEAEEMLAVTIVADDLTDRSITIDTNVNNFDLYATYTSIYGAPTAADVSNGVTLAVFVNSGIIVGSATGSPAFRVDSSAWPASFPISITVNGRIQGKGGTGGQGGRDFVNGANGGSGGVALYTRTAIDLTSTNGEIWGGGGAGAGGGAGSGGFGDFYGGGGGGGGAGTQVGAAGAGGDPGLPSPSQPGQTGQPGTATTGGSAGAGGTGIQSGGAGGAGGGPGLAGAAGGNGTGGGGKSNGGSGGAAGAAIDGDSFVTDIGGVGDIRGGQIN